MDYCIWRVVRTLNLSLKALKDAPISAEEKEKLFKEIILSFLLVWEDNFSVFLELINWLAEKKEYEKPAKQALEEFLTYQGSIYGEPIRMFKELLGRF
jgi:hypothetical protein